MSVDAGGAPASSMIDDGDGRRGTNDVGVVQEPVDGGVGDGLGHQLVEAGRVEVGVSAIERFS